MCIKQSIPMVWLALMLAPAGLLAADDIDSGLAECAALNDAAARLACFDALAARISVNVNRSAKSASSAEAVAQPAPKEAAVSVPAVSAAATEVRIPLDDSVGELADEDPADRPTYLGRLTRCEQTGPTRRTVFFLENGQVWRQKNSDRLRIRDCEADIEITKDRIGFKLAVWENRTRVTPEMPTG